MLAEPKRKQRICLDPQNLSWRNDTNAFGKKLMEQMGWRDGLGLGKNGEGIRENVRQSANHTQTGLGFSGSTYKSDFASHDVEFSRILAKLNEDKPTKVCEEEQGTVTSGVRLNILNKSERNFIVNIRRKRRPILSSEQKIAIFGRTTPEKLNENLYLTRNNAGKEAKEKTNEEEMAIKEESSPSSSSVTMDVYFAQKKAKIKGTAREKRDGIEVVHKETKRKKNLKQKKSETL